MSDLQIIVPGGLNTDIVGLGIEKLLGKGELTIGGQLKVGPGGKARNMAQMAAAYLGKDKVAMIGRTSKDPFGFWKLPVQSLQDANVDTRFIKIMGFDKGGKKYPGIALIPVDKNGNNQIYVLPGVNADFNQQDIDEAETLFQNDNKKILLLALEIPIETALYAIDKAIRKGIRVILDPGGISASMDELMERNIFLLKPNEHEAKILTGIDIYDFETATKAANRLLSKGVQNVLITHGAKGGYLFTKETRKHIPIPHLESKGVQDETGCGDQVTGIIAACLAEGRSLVESVELSVIAGTLQFYREGIQPVEKETLLKFQSRNFNQT